MRTTRLLRGARGLAVAVSLGLALATASPDASAQHGKPAAAPKPKPKPKPPVTPPPERPPAGHEKPTHEKPAHEKPASAASGIPVTVVEVAATQAYLQPGASGGVHRGSKVTIGHKQYTVLQTTAAYAVVDFGRESLREQEKGTATVVTEEEDKAAELAKPRPLATWEHAWTEAESPALAQTPRFVPLGGAERDRRYDVRLSTAFGALVPFGRGAGIGRVEINTRIHAEPFSAPLAFDLDLSVQRWFAPGLDNRNGSGARPTVWLREALVGYGTGGWYAGLGRMRYAAATLGTLDGARVRAPLGAGFGIGAFGGVLPEPLNGSPSLVAQRFGVEASYSRPDAELRPEAALVFHGSMFDGKLDERRMSAVFGLYPGLTRIGGHAEVSSFDKDNPWKASSIELTAAGLDASVRAGIFQFGGRFDLRQPIRSRWLASFLPATWFCRTTPAPAGSPPGTPDPCDGSVSTRALGALDAGIEVGNVRVTVGATTIGDLTQTGGAPDMKGGFAAGRVVRIAKVLRIDASANYSTATYIDMFGGSAGPGVTLFDEVLDLGAYYRYGGLTYRSVSTGFTQHGIGGTAMLFPTSELVFTMQGEGIAGDDVSALMLFGTAMWRPRF